MSNRKVPDKAKFKERMKLTRLDLQKIREKLRITPADLVKIKQMLRNVPEKARQRRQPRPEAGRPS